MKRKKEIGCQGSSLSPLIHKYNIHASCAVFFELSVNQNQILNMKICFKWGISNKELVGPMCELTS